jgi:hypothetical protein
MKKDVVRCTDRDLKIINFIMLLCYSPLSLLRAGIVTSSVSSQVLIRALNCTWPSGFLKQVAIGKGSIFCNAKSRSPFIINWPLEGTCHALAPSTVFKTRLLLLSIHVRLCLRIGLLLSRYPTNRLPFLNRSIFLESAKEHSRERSTIDRINT